MRKRFSAAIMAIAVSIAMLSPSAQIKTHAENIETIPVTGTYEQTSARNMLASINAFRTGADAWYWNKENTSKVECQNLNNLVYDYDLETVAMQRAMEIAVSFSHQRPNGTKCFTAFTYQNSQGSRGENIAYGYPSAEAAFNAWREDNEPYAGQGHRRNMLSYNYNCVAVGHVIKDDVDYWVQEFRTTAISTAETPAENGIKTVNVDCLSSMLAYDVNTRKIDLTYGNSSDLSDVCEIFYYKDELNSDELINAGYCYDEYYNNKHAIKTTPITNFTVSDSSVISVSGKTLTATGAGSANLQGTLSNGQAFSIPVTVKPQSLKSAYISYISSQEYTGSEIKPAVTVTYNSKTLVSGTDYDISYSNNTNVGTATVTITGKGNYTDSKTTTFTIKKSTNNKTDKSNQNNNNNNDDSNNDYDNDPDNSSENNASQPLSKITKFSLKKGKGNLTVKWTKASGANGYEIQYSTNKKFKNTKKKSAKASKNSLKISKLKSGKKYYVRIRYYKNSGTKKVYSKWSNAKNIKVK